MREADSGAGADRPGLRGAGAADPGSRPGSWRPRWPPWWSWWCCRCSSSSVGSVRGEAGLSVEHFTEALTGRLYLQALQNSLVLGAWTGLFSILIGLPMAWAVSRTNVPAPGLFRITATLAYLSPPFLTAIAYVNLLSPNAGVINVFLRDVVGAPWLTFNIFSMSGLVLVTTLHTFPFVFLLASTRAAVGRCLLRGGSADPRRRQAAHRARA